MIKNCESDSGHGDSRALASERHRGIGFATALAFTTSRDLIARGLVAIGVTPNVLTVLGFLMTCGAAACFFLGGGYTHAGAREAGFPPYCLIAVAFLFCSFACDMLDGAVARIGNLHTPFGAILDSTLDRCSDAVIYIGLIGHFAMRGNLTYVLLSAVAVTSALLISYLKARSENIIPDCGVGYWLRGERCAAIIIAACAGTLPAVIWQQALSPTFTVLRRLVWTSQTLSAQAGKRPFPSNAPPRGLLGLLRPWRFPRKSLPYDIITILNILFIIFAARLHPVFGPDSDPIRAWLDLAG